MQDNNDITGHTTKTSKNAIERQESYKPSHKTGTAREEQKDSQKQSIDWRLPTDLTSITKHTKWSKTECPCTIKKKKKIEPPMLQVLDLKQIRLQLTLTWTERWSLPDESKGEVGSTTSGRWLKMRESHRPLWVTWNSTDYCEPDRRPLCPGTCRWSSSVRYTGALPFKVLYVRRRTLNPIRCFTGSQCRDYRTGLMCSYFFVSVTSLAAMFWMRWNFAIWASGSPNKRLLQLSMRDVMKAWTSFSVMFLSR